MAEIEILKARLEAVAHAAAVLLASRLSELPAAERAQVCAMFAGPLVPPNLDLPAALPFETNAVRRDRRAAMLDTLEAIADRALVLSGA